MTKRATFSIVAAAVLLVTSNANGNLTGTISGGTFSVPSPPCVGTVVCAGVGTNTFSWGDTSSTLTFTPGSADPITAAAFIPGSAFNNVPLGVQFVMGRLSFSNSATTIGTEVSGVTLTLLTGTVVGNAGENSAIYSNQLVPVLLGIENTPNTADPLASADIVTILANLSCTPCDGNVRFNVLEGESTSVLLLGRFGSVFVTQFCCVAEPPKGFLSSVPGPSSLALVGGGLIALILARQRGRMREPRQR